MASKKYIKIISILYLLCFSIINLYSQNSNFLNHNTQFNKSEQQIYKASFTNFTSVKSLFISEIESLLIRNYSSQLLIKSKIKNKIPTIIWNKIFNEHLIDIHKENFHLQIDPLMDFQAGMDIISHNKTNINTRGFYIQGKIVEKISFSSGFYENQAIFPSYIDSIIRKNQIIPGQGMYKSFKKNGFDYAYSFGHISYSPSKIINFQLGHGKNFWGDGYRSLILSDAAYNYPYFKITTKVWHLKYTNLWAEFQDINHRNSFTDGWQKKYGAFHYLSWNVTNRFELSFFEAIIWQGRDSLNNRSFDIQYLNPIIFYRPVEFSLGSPDNALMGLNLRYTIGNNTALYGQVVLDEFKFSEVKAGNGWWGNKQAFQLGFKSWIPIQKLNRSKVESLKQSTIYLQSEFNYVRPYMYTHSNPIQNYGHYNQSLAHPLGANFMESVNIIRYNYKRFFVEAKYVWARYGEDFDGANYGRDIYLGYNSRIGDYNNFVAQGEKTTLTHSNLNFSWLVNPSYNLHISVGISDVLQKSETHSLHNTLIFLGLRTSIRNIYYDY